MCHSLCHCHCSGTGSCVVCDVIRCAAALGARSRGGGRARSSVLVLSEPIPRRGVSGRARQQMRTTTESEEKTAATATATADSDTVSTPRPSGAAGPNVAHCRFFHLPPRQRRAGDSRAAQHAARVDSTVVFNGNRRWHAFHVRSGPSDGAAGHAAVPGRWRGFCRGILDGIAGGNQTSGQEQQHVRFSARQHSSVAVWVRLPRRAFVTDRVRLLCAFYFPRLASQLIPIVTSSALSLLQSDGSAAPGVHMAAPTSASTVSPSLNAASSPLPTVTPTHEGAGRELELPTEAAISMLAMAAAMHDGQRHHFHAETTGARPQAAIQAKTNNKRKHMERH